MTMTMTMRDVPLHRQGAGMVLQDRPGTQHDAAAMGHLLGQGQQEAAVPRPGLTASMRST